MNRQLHIFLISSLLLLFANQNIYAQKNLETQIADSLTTIANNISFIGKVKVLSLIPNPTTNTLIINANEKLNNIPFRIETVKRIYTAISKITSRKYAGYSLICQVENKKIEDLIPNYYRTSNIDSTRLFSIQPAQSPLVKNISHPYEIFNGLLNRHIALWQSHGKYYDQKQTRWVWQRARFFQTVEDLYTQSYVLQFLVPMLENAGANVLLPRERDTQTTEVIIDNDNKDTKDNCSKYVEINDKKHWKNGDNVGFANPKKFYLQGENPFTMGTFRSIQTVNKSNDASYAEWYPAFADEGTYAVYVSYKTQENSTSDAHYTIIHKGIKTEYRVNQTMNGGTWLYLGSFNFDKGKNNQNKVIISNLSSEKNKIVTADAVKFGGGMGNIARNPTILSYVQTPKSTDSLTLSAKIPTPKFETEPETSHYPRYTEGARYWLQWAGIPDSIYSRTKGLNDYSDDFQSRGFWVNYLASGSVVLPKSKGMNVPIDLALAFHSDAGITLNDSIIGTLGICTLHNSDGKIDFQNAVSRYASRDLTDIVQNQIVDDIRKQFAPEWTRRGLWNKSYSESRVPEVPSMLLEILAHQNFADMRYGLDPRFRFTVSRAVYKGILKYLSSANNVKFVVEPLPVEQFSCQFVKKNKLKLHWKAVIDSLEPSAKADKFIVYTRIDNSDFDNGRIVSTNDTTISVQTGKIYSFKITAINSGGESFPSEILSAYRAPNENQEVLIINSFNRISAPSSFSIDSIYGGFLNDYDAGVPFISDIAFVGKQYDFNRKSRWTNDDSPGFGGSNANFETTVIAGNNFDYPFIHGRAIKSAEHSFVSASVKAVLEKDLDINHYKIVDVILGKQKQTFVGNAKKQAEFKTFPLALQQIIQGYCQNGGNLMVSGAYVASDLNEFVNSTAEDRQFIENTLKLKFRTSHASICGDVKVVSSEFKNFKKTEFSYFDQPNTKAYYVESPDAIEPINEDGATICRYSENEKSAAVAYSGNYKVCTFGFPFECIQSEKERENLMQSILSFLSSNK